MGKGCMHYYINILLLLDTIILFHYLQGYVKSSSESHSRIYDYYRMIEQVKHDHNIMKRSCWVIANNPGILIL